MKITDSGFNLITVFVCVFMCTWATISHSTDMEIEMNNIRMLSANGNYEAALDSTDTLLGAKPDNPELLFLKATVLEKSGNTREAVRIYKDMTINYPELPEPFNNLAIYYSENGDYESAINALETALQSHESYATAFINLRAIYDKLASDAYRKALNSTSPEPALELAALDHLSLPEIEVAPVIVAQIDTENFVTADILNSEPDTTTGSADTLEDTENIVLALAETETDQSVTTSNLVAANTTGASSIDNGNQANSSESTLNGNDNLASEVGIVLTAQDSESLVVTEEIDVSSLSSSTVAESQTLDGDADTSEDLDSGVKRRVESWAAAWANRQYEKYLTHYSGEFIPRDNMTLDEWKEQRKGRLLWREFIVVELSNMVIDVDGENATAKFTQYYKSNVYEGTGGKTLKLKRKNGDWFITRELI